MRRVVHGSTDDGRRDLVQHLHPCLLRARAAPFRDGYIQHSLLPPSLRRPYFKVTSLRLLRHSRSIARPLLGPRLDCANHPLQFTVPTLREEVTRRDRGRDAVRVMH